MKLQNKANWVKAGAEEDAAMIIGTALRQDSKHEKSEVTCLEAGPSS